jgi:hypothetical protein
MKAAGAIFLLIGDHFFLAMRDSVGCGESAYMRKCTHNFMHLQWIYLIAADALYLFIPWRVRTMCPTFIEVLFSFWRPGFPTSRSTIWRA